MSEVLTIEDVGVFKHIVRDARQVIAGVRFKLKHYKSKLGASQQVISDQMMTRLDEDSRTLENIISRSEKLTGNYD